MNLVYVQFFCLFQVVMLLFITFCCSWNCKFILVFFSLMDDHQVVELVRHFVTFIEMFQNIFQTNLATPFLEFKGQLENIYDLIYT